MKPKLEAKLLKAKGCLKTAARFTPLMVILAGLGVFTGLMTGGTFKRVDAIEQFKQTPIFSEAYSQEYEEFDRQYKNNEINAYELNEKVEYLDSDNYALEVLKNSGEEMQAIKDKVQTGKYLQIASIPVAAMAIGGAFLLYPWLLEPNLDRKLRESVKLDFGRAHNIKLAEEQEKKKKSIFMGDEEINSSNDVDDEEEILPDISDTYYRD